MLKVLEHYLCTNIIFLHNNCCYSIDYREYVIYSYRELDQLLTRLNQRTINIIIDHYHNNDSRIHINKDY